MLIISILDIGIMFLINSTPKSKFESMHQSRNLDESTITSIRGRFSLLLPSASMVKHTTP